MRAEGSPGKLIGAAEHWFGQSKVDEQDLLDDAAFYNITFPEPAEPAAPEHFEVWLENWDSVCLFLRCATQWRVTMQGVTGLDYGAVTGVLSLYPVGSPSEVFEGLQEMEARAVELINAAAEKAAKRTTNRRSR